MYSDAFDSAFSHDQNHPEVSLEAISGFVGVPFPLGVIFAFLS